jgi:hypothetical protein
MELILFKNKEEQNKEITHSLEILFEEYQEKLNKIKSLSDQSSEYGEVIGYFLNANEVRLSYSNLFDYDKAKDVLNSEMWDKTIKMTNVLKYMPAEDRNKWSNDIHEYNTPDFDKEIVVPTIQNLLISQDNFFAKKVDGIFRNLSGEHVTNSPNGFNKKMIISNILTSYNHPNSDKTAFIDDLRFSISKIIGIKNNDFENRRTYDDINNILNSEQFGKWFSIDGGLLRLKLFKKGTAHLEVFPSVAIKLNQILATLYPMAIPAKHREINKKVKEFKLEKDFLSSSVLSELDNMIQKLRRGKSFFYYPTRLKSDDNKKIKEIIQLIDGTFVDNYLSFSYDPTNVLMSIKMQGYIPERQSHQFYPTEESLSELAIEMLKIEKFDKVLEPSAGNGRLVDKLTWMHKQRITCLDISKTQYEILKEKGYKAQCIDFLKYSINEESLFSKIIMNPPFTKGQAKLHVEKALKHLDEEGKMIAIIPSSLRNKININEKEFSFNYTDNIENAFLESNTKVSVCLLKVKRKSNESLS